MTTTERMATTSTVTSASRRVKAHFSGRKAHQRLNSRSRLRQDVVSAATAPDGTSLDALLKVAVEAAKEGGNVMSRKVGADVIKTKVNARDLLTEVDGEVQSIIETRVAQAFPTHGFLGEESVAAGKDASADALRNILQAGTDWLWIVDPIDGTTNFVHGMPLSAISIGVAFKGELQAAVILDPFRDECFTAALGQGAKLNGSTMKVGEESTALEAVVVTGYAPTTASTEVMLRGMTALANLPVRTIRMLGSAAIMLAWVACGRVTAYFEADLNSWDTAAGALLIREAGGQITNLVGDEYDLTTRPILASNKTTHDELLRCLMDS